MKKLTNKQRCKNCIHKSVCKWYGTYDELDYLGERCKYYFSKERAFQKKKSEDTGMSRQERWEKNLEMLKSGALGDITSPKTLLKYWQMQESAGYPYASENVKYFEDMVRKESEDTE